MFSRGIVLIVDPSPDSRDVLRTVLEQRGLRILEAGAAEEGLELALRHRPDVVILDLEQETCDAAQAGDLASELDSQSIPLVLIGTMRRNHPPVQEGRFVAKPYHYAPLIRKIDALLEKAPQPAANAA